MKGIFPLPMPLQEMSGKGIFPALTYFLSLAHLQSLQLGPALLCLLDEVWCLFFIVLQLVRGRAGSSALTLLEPALL